MLIFSKKTGINAALVLFAVAVFHVSLAGAEKPDGIDSLARLDEDNPMDDPNKGRRDSSSFQSDIRSSTYPSTFFMNEEWSRNSIVALEEQIASAEEKSIRGDHPRILQATLKPVSKKPSLRPTTRKPTTSKPSPKPTSKNRKPTKKPTPKRRTRKPTKKPTFRPSTSAPSSQPTYEPSFVPSSSPSQIPLLFDGIENADSIFAGKIDFNWDFPSYEGEIPDLETIIYHVFSSVGSYDFSSALENSTVSELITKFKDNDNDNTTQYHRVEGKTMRFSINTTFIHEIQTILVVAEAGGVFSRNTKTTELYPSTSDPIVKDDVNVVGIFVASERLTISLSSDNVLDFMGPVRSEHLNLKVGDFINGFTSDFQYFFLHITKIVISSNKRVLLITEEGRLEDIFDLLNYEASFAISRPDKVALTPSSLKKHRHLIAKMRVQRILGFGDWFNDNFVKPIGDFFGDVKEGFEDAWNFLKNGNLEKSFDIVNIREEFLWELSPLPEEPEKPKDPEIEASLGNVAGLVEVRIDLYVKLAVNIRELMAEAGIRADYGADFAFNLGPKAGLKGERKLYEVEAERVFVIVGVPVQIDIKAALEAKFSITVDASDGLIQLNIGGRGGGHMSAAASTSRGLSHDSKLPDFIPYFDFKASDGMVSSEISISLEPSVTVGLYKGALSAKFVIPIGPSLEMSFRQLRINGDAMVAVETFDLNFDITGNIEIGSELVEDPLKSFELFKKTWPIISLPEPSFPQKARHYCDESSDGKRSAYIENVLIEESDDDAFIHSSFKDTTWFLGEELSKEWSLQQDGPFKAKLTKKSVESSSSMASGSISVAAWPRLGVIDFPFPIIYSVELDSIVLDKTVECMRNGICSESFFDGMAQEFSSVFNSKIFLSQAPDPVDPPFPSTVYKFEDFMKALHQLKAKNSFHMWLGDGCGLDAKTRAIVNIAAFLGQAMRETIIYDACDENNWDSWRADVFKEPTSPPEYLSAFYPMSSSCGQLGQSYEDYDCPDACPKDPKMEITGTTNADWIGAPPPLFCGPRAKYDGLGYWNPMKFCQGPGKSCVGQPFYYAGQTAGYYTSIAEDPKYPKEYYANPLPDASGAIQQPRFENLPRSNVEGCCWWGRGVIQTTGRCNFGKLNKSIGAGANRDSLYPDINFCTNPQAICTGPKELKWIAGIFFWVAEVESYKAISENYKAWVHTFVDMGCADSPDLEGCDRLFEYASGIVNRGCHNPGESGCSSCIPGATCGPAHKVPERISASKQVLRALMNLPGNVGTCGSGDRGNGICPIKGDCCSKFGWCGITPDHCGDLTVGTCGSGDRGNGICPNKGDCCSKFGWCGSTPDHCST